VIVSSAPLTEAARGKCPPHEAKRNNASFSFHVVGGWNCFSCGKKGRGAIDLAIAIKGVEIPRGRQAPRLSRTFIPKYATTSAITKSTRFIPVNI
jgi:hypothetical protein